MSQAIDFFTIEGQQALSIFSVTSEVAGHEAEMAFDHSLNSYWKPTSNATQNIILDLGSDKSINGFSLFLRNHDTKIKGIGGCILTWGNSSSGPWNTHRTITFSSDQTIGDPILTVSSVSAVTKQFWRLQFVFLDSNALPEVSHIFLWQKRSITSFSQFPEADPLGFAGKAQAAHGNRLGNTPVNRQAITTFTRKWLIIGDTDKATLDSVFADCSGRVLPLLFQEDSGAIRVVEIQDIRFGAEKLQHQQYNPTLTFRTLPFIKEGEAY